MTIYSFRRVLRVQHVIRNIRWNGKVYPLRWPIPLRTLSYFVAIEAAFTLLAFLPISGALTRLLPLHAWWVIPAVIVAELTWGKFDGRPPHRWLQSWIAYQRRPRRTLGGRRVPVDGDRRRIKVSARAWHDEVTHP